MHAIITCGYVLKTISQFVFLGKSNGSQGNVSILQFLCHGQIEMTLKLKIVSVIMKCMRIYLKLNSFVITMAAFNMFAHLS